MSTISSDKAQIIAAAWKKLEETRPDYYLELLAQVVELEEARMDGTGKFTMEGLVKLAWMSGFTHCLMAIETGALRPLSPAGTKPANN